MSHFDYFRSVIRDPKVAALTGSSRYAVQKIIQELPHPCMHIIEYGAGEGVVTRKLLAVLPRQAKVFAVELNPFLVSKLKKIHDPRLVILHENVLDVSQRLAGLGVKKFDAAISGIPLSFWAGTSPKNRNDIIRRTSGMLRKGGRFIVYQFTPVSLPSLKKYFRKTSWTCELRNFPPYFVMTATK